MGSGETSDALRNAFEQFSQPFTTMDQLKIIPMRLDAIVAILLATPYVRNRFGPVRASELSKASPELPGLLRELGDTRFVEAAEAASNLLEISRSSVGEFDDEIATANTERQRFYKACAGIVASINP
jgi:hypothetical protein